MFWNKKQEPEIKEDTAGIPVSEDSKDDGLSQVSSLLSDAINSKSSGDESVNTLRDIASKRAESIGLGKFPKEMSCLTAMDELMECMSLGGQVRNYYRYGDLTLCEKQSEKLSFCFSNSLNTGEIKEQNIQDFYKNKLVEEMKRGSSEDIWEARD